jgi:putative transposase
MPDHVHLLIEAPRDAVDFQRTVRLLKSRSGFYFKKHFGRTLWQRSYFDRTLRRDEDVYGVVQYIFENPVRARLVKSPKDYPFLGATFTTVEKFFDELEDSW